jgi:uncharacterized protein (DUF2147 family)
MDLVKGPSGTGGKNSNCQGAVGVNGAIFTEVLIMRHHAFAAAMGVLTAALLAPSSPSQAASADPTGYWMKPDAERESKIQVFKCGKGKTQLCAKIAWLKDPNDSKGKPLHDIRNEEPSLRGRAIVGLTIFTGMTPSAPSTWSGKIYNPEDGHTYTATLTVLSRKEIKLRGCKAWLLCGEKQWLRTSAPEELQPTAPAEGTQQIEASVTPSSPPSIAAATPLPEAEVRPVAAVSTPAAASEAPTAAPAPHVEGQALLEADASAEAKSTEAPQESAALPVQEVAVPVAAPVEYGPRRGYGFLNVSADPQETARLSGENVSSMMVMSEPVATGVPAEQVEPASAARNPEPVPLPAPKPKPKAIAAAAVKPPSKPMQAKASAQPAPQEAAAEADADPATEDAVEAKTTQSADADAVMEEPPLTRRQRRLLRRQQQQGDAFLPWLR